MKGLTKAIKRTPHLMTSKVGMSKRSTDPEFDDYQRKFIIMEDTIEKLLKDCKKFNDAVIALFTAGTGFANHFATLFKPLAGEFDLLGTHPEATDTVRNVDIYHVAFEELRASISPELELIESRIVGPTKELQTIMKQIRKSITKRDHKLVDYDRFNNSLTKLRDKKEKTLNDEKNLFKLEQDFEIAATEYDYINNAMKSDLPRFMVLAVQFIDPLFHSFFYMQLNIFYLMLEKLNGFVEGKYDVQLSGPAIAADYEEKRTDAWQVIENMHITKRIVSTSKMLQANRAASGSEKPASVGRAVSSSSTSTTSTYMSRTTAPPPTPSGFSKKPPPAPPSAHVPAAPPPYSASAPSSAAAAANLAAVTAIAAKRAPPPPPPLKPKPKLEPPVQYVVALYDFAGEADGDLAFSTGDRIEVVERTESAEDWWTGKLNGQRGVFPGNYVQDT